MSQKGAVKQMVLASNNRHKVKEIQAIFGPSWRVLSVAEIAPGLRWDETGQTFLENARIKINALRPHVSGLILADDSGLCVDALGGEPGVHSSSYGGVEGDHTRNTAKLLQVMESIPDGRRQAHFYCLLLLVDEQNQEHLFEGRCEGKIASSGSGVGGFGYDPVFIPLGFSQSMAVLSAEEKNAISHRGRAMASLKKFLLDSN